MNIEVKMAEKRKSVVIAIVSSLLIIPFFFSFAFPEAVSTPSNNSYLKKIIYVFEDSAANYQIGMMDMKGENKTMLTREGNNWCPVISPLMDKIAFFSDRSGFSNLWSMNTDGTLQTQLTFNRESINKIDLTNRGQIAWIKPAGQNSESIYFLKLGDIWSIDNTGEEASVLTQFHDVTSFKFSPDSSAYRILFAREKTKNHNGLWTMNINGTDLRQITESIYLVAAYDWGDNNTIAYFNNRAVAVVQFSGLEKKSIKETFCINNEIVWSKINIDSSKNRIAYINDKNEGPNIWVMSPDGSADTQITSHNGFSPCWSSDGQALIFVEDNNIYIKNINEKEKTRLTYNFSAFFPIVAEIKTNSAAVK
jgi:Tol biopolymer transport system component